MTQKELLYFEDAIGHEKSIISILSKSVENIESEEIKKFLLLEKENHINLLNDLMSFLEGKVNE